MSIREKIDKAIRDILEAPETNLSRVSMRAVRARLPEKDPNFFTDKWISDNMDAIDKRIVVVFEQVNVARSGG